MQENGINTDYVSCYQEGNREFRPVAGIPDLEHPFGAPEYRRYAGTLSGSAETRGGGLRGTGMSGDGLPFAESSALC